jgi:hypothetical protein
LPSEVSLEDTINLKQMLYDKGLPFGDKICR